MLLKSVHKNSTIESNLKRTEKEASVIPAVVLSEFLKSDYVKQVVSRLKAPLHGDKDQALQAFEEERDVILTKIIMETAEATAPAPFRTGRRRCSKTRRKG